jgi:hypothetical protein
MQMTGKTFEETVRSILSSGRSEEVQGTEIAALIEMRMDSFGNFFFVRKGAPIDLSLIRASDRVHIDELSDIKRVKKLDRYLAHKTDKNYPGPLILAEGDSWFEYFWAKDMIEYAGVKYAILSLARGGDTWAEIINQDSDPEKRYPEKDHTLMGLRHNLQQMDKKRPFNYVMLSAGGNDLIGQIRFCVHRYDPDRSLDDYLIRGNGVGFDAVLGLAMKHYKSAADYITGLGISVILHTYDYPNPMSGGQYIGSPLENYCHFPQGSVGLMRRVVNQMINLFHDGLADIAKQLKGKVHLIDLRKTIGTDDVANGPDIRFWYDEMHGNKFGAEKLWLRMDKDLTKIF